MPAGSTTHRVAIKGAAEVQISSGVTLLAGLAQDGVFLPSACGGRGMCGLCKVKVLAGAGRASEREAAKLGDLLEQGFRLACQIRVEGDLEIELASQVMLEGRMRMVCTATEDLTGDTRLFRLGLIEPEYLEFVPGQYLRLLCPPYPGSPEPVTREYSIASDPRANRMVELIIRRAPKGICTTYLFEHLGPGQEVFTSRPMGQFRLRSGDAPAIFVAGGSGLAPFVSILHDMANKGSKRPATLFFGARTVKDLYLMGLMDRFRQRLPGFRFVPVVSNLADGQRWDGQVGMVTDAIARAYDDLSGHEGYLCGPPGMIDATMEMMLRLGMSQDQIYHDKFG